MVMKKSARKRAASISSKAAKVIGAGEFKAHCLQIMDEVAATGEPIVVTKRGKAVVTVVPHVPDKPEPFRPLFGLLKGSVTIHGDIIGPTGIEWEGDVRNI
jgi:prevent-host-death family protein